MNILSLFACFELLLPLVAIRQLTLLAQAILTLTGRISMLGISRWTEKGGSYRTIERFFSTLLPWHEMFAKFFETNIFNPEHEYILAGDETVVSKSGKQTFGIDRFFSGLKGTVIKGLSFFVLSLVDVTERKSYPISVVQTVKNETEKQAFKSREKRKTKKPKVTKGRRKGSLNRDKNEIRFSPELLRISEIVSILLKLTRHFIKLKYLAMDGHFGHNQAVLMARANGLELISKLRKDAAIYEKYEGNYSGKGAPKKYGERLKYDILSPKYLRKSEQEKQIITNYYQGVFLHKEFAKEINVVIIVKINLQTQKVGHAILLSSDVELSSEKLVDYYSLRFQIEFNFRDAKQYFGLEDFMNTTQVGVANAANLSFMMILLSAKLLTNKAANGVGINDLKTRFRGIKYAVLTLKKVLKNPEPILMKEIIEEVSQLGSIYQHKSAT